MMFNSICTQVVVYLLVVISVIQLLYLLEVTLIASKIHIPLDYLMIGTFVGDITVYSLNSELNARC